MAQGNQSLRLGVALPQTDIGGDPAAMRDFAQASEELGYDHLVTYDHVLGANPGADDTDTTRHLYHDPFVLLGFVAACTRRIELSVQVLILPQRNPVVLAKQLATMDYLSGGRMELGIGLRWIGRRPVRPALLSGLPERPGRTHAPCTRATKGSKSPVQRW